MNGKTHHKQDKHASDTSECEEYLKNNVEAILDFKTTDKLEELLNNLESYVRCKGEGISTHQLRNIFSIVKRAKTRQELQLIRPKLAYVGARQNNKNAKEFVGLIEKIVKKVTDDNHVKNFIAFFEAIVAYHKFHQDKK